MSKKNIYKAFKERGKKHNPYYNQIKLNSGSNKRNLSLQDVEDLEDSLMYKSSFYELKRWKKDYYTEGVSL
jgi:hypothetical protein